MIIDNIKNNSRYNSCHINIQKALSFIMEKAEDAALEDGKYVVVTDEVIAYVVSKETKNRQDMKMEIHKNFMDIHYILEGSERCCVSELSQNISYDEETDNGFYDIQDTGSILVQKGEFYAVWPMEPHCPLCNPKNKSEKVKKIICKVKVE